MKTLRALTAVAGLLAAAASYASAKLDVGSKAPELKVAKWLKGTETKSFKKGNVYVVEFWATWCGPCLQSIPHLTEMANKYKGKVNFTGVSVFESQSGPTDASYIPKVADFVKSMGAKMDYNVAVDGTDKYMANTWMKASEEPGIPTAFIVDQEGDVAWIGHPMADLEPTLEKVLAKKWDKKTFAVNRAESKAKEAKINSAFRDLQAAIKAKDWPLTERKANEIKAAQPEMTESVDMNVVLGVLAADESIGYHLAKKFGATSLSKNPMALNSIAWFIVGDDSKAKTPDYPLAVDLMKRAMAAGGDKDAAIIDTFAMALYRNGQIDEAIAEQEKALAMINADPKADARLKKDVADRLAMLKAKKGS